MSEYSKLKKYNTWKNSFVNKVENPFWNYIADNINAEDVYILIDIIKPEFIEHKNLIFFKNRFSVDNFNEWMKHTNGDILSVQSVINEIHIYDIFPSEGTEVDDAVFAKIGLFLRDCWDNELKKLYPDKNIIVEYSNTESDYGPTLYVFQKNAI